LVHKISVRPEELLSRERGGQRTLFPLVATNSVSSLRQPYHTSTIIINPKIDPSSVDGATTTATNTEMNSSPYRFFDVYSLLANRLKSVHVNQVTLPTLLVKQARQPSYASLYTHNEVARTNPTFSVSFGVISEDPNAGDIEERSHQQSVATITKLREKRESIFYYVDSSHSSAEQSAAHISGVMQTDDIVESTHRERASKVSCSDAIAECAVFRHVLLGCRALG
jgi:hypothetical protein